MMLSILSRGAEWAVSSPGIKSIYKRKSSCEERTSLIASQRVREASASKPRSLSLLERLPVLLLQNLLLEYVSPRDWNSLGRSSLYMSEAMNDKIMWANFYEELQEKHSNVTNLDKLGAGPCLGLPEYHQEVSIEALKRRAYILANAGILAKLSEDGRALILTIPAGWSLRKAEELYRQAREEQLVEGRIATSGYLSSWHDGTSKDKTIVITSSFMRDSGLRGLVPDTQSMTTVIALSRILTRHESLYSSPIREQPFVIRTATKSIRVESCLDEFCYYLALFSCLEEFTYVVSSRSNEDVLLTQSVMFLGVERPHGLIGGLEYVH